MTPMPQHSPQPDAFPPSGSRHLPDSAATHALGRDLGAQLHAGDVVILSGPLGAGKTALTQGIAAALQVQGRVTSPTFQLARRHAPHAPDTPGLVHVDAYRLRGEDGAATAGDAAAAQSTALLDELESLDLDSFLDSDVVVIEWGEGIGERLSPQPWLVELDRDDESDTRTAHWRRLG